jgi:hypothetical protein
LISELAGNDRFAIVSRLGAGGFGVVYDAEGGSRARRASAMLVPGFAE